MLSLDYARDKYWKQDYYAFGSDYPSTTLGTGGAPATGNTHKFTGHVQDAATGQYYAKARYFTTQLGRWSQPEPLLKGVPPDDYLYDPQKLNPYVYSLNNPLKYVDKDGNDATVAALEYINTGSEFVVNIPPALQAVLVIPAAFTAGWMIGTAINDNIIQPIIQQPDLSTTTQTTTSTPQPQSTTLEQSNSNSNTKSSEKTGPSGKPQINKVKHSSKKSAKDAARNEGKGKPVKHSKPQKGKPHYHPVDKDGNKIPGSTHHEYPI